MLSTTGLSTGERKMLHSAKQILISEIVLSKSVSYESARVLLQPFHMLNQTVQLLLNLFRRPGHHLPALLLRLAAPAQAIWSA